MFAQLMGIDTISPSRLQELMQREPVTVIDVNSPQSWRQAHVPGALNFDPFGASDAALPADRESTLVFYCSNLLCRKAPRAARRVKALGYRRVLVMSAGISGWLGASLPTESAEAHLKTR